MKRGLAFLEGAADLLHCSLAINAGRPTHDLCSVIPRVRAAVDIQVVGSNAV